MVITFTGTHALLEQSTLEALRMPRWCMRALGMSTDVTLRQAAQATFAFLRSLRHHYRVAARASVEFIHIALK